MKRLRVYRHGEADKNVKAMKNGREIDVVGGRASDSPPTAKGLVHSQRVGERLSYLAGQGLVVPNRLHFASSTAVRARVLMETARDVMGLTDQPVREYDDFEELFQGDWEGRDKEEPMVIDGVSYSYLPPHKRPPHYNVGNAEELEAATERTLRVLSAIALATPEGGTTAVGSHGITTRLAVNAIMRLAHPGILPTKMGYGAETLIEIDGDTWHVPYVGLPTDEPNAPLSRAIWQPDAV